jgi:hypothetical protein
VLGTEFIEDLDISEGDQIWLVIQAIHAFPAKA